MIEYKVNVPRGRAELFEKAVHKIKDARVVLAKTARESIVRRELRKHRRILDRIQKKKSKEVQRGINLGYQKLLKDVVGEANRYKDNPLLQSDKLTDREFRLVVTSLLEKGMEAKPRLVTADDERVGWDTVANSLDPKTGQALIFRYGLIDGRQRSKAEAYQAIGLSSQTSKYLFIEGLSQIASVLIGKNLLVTSSPSFQHGDEQVFPGTAN